MTHDHQPDSIQQIIGGFALLMLCHFLAGLLIVILGYIIGSIIGGYSVLTVWMVGAAGFLFWQLLYVIPLILWLKKRGKTGMVTGVIVGAVITALINGACFVTMF